jgi:hypothetical protein
LLFTHGESHRSYEKLSFHFKPRSYYMPELKSRQIKFFFEFFCIFLALNAHYRNTKHSKVLNRGNYISCVNYGNIEGNIEITYGMFNLAKSNLGLANPSWVCLFLTEHTITEFANPFFFICVFEWPLKIFY